MSETEVEKQRWAVADAILAERAAAMLRRRYDLRDIKVPERIFFTVTTLDAEAQRLRSEAEHSV